MRTKNIFTILVAMLLVACNQKPYPEKDAKLLIQNRIKKCIKVDKVDADNFNNGLVTYAAIDSAYNTFSFLVTPKGEIIPWYKNGRWIKKIAL